MHDQEKNIFLFRVKSLLDNIIEFNLKYGLKFDCFGLLSIKYIIIFGLNPSMSLMHTCRTFFLQDEKSKDGCGKIVFFFLEIKHDSWLKKNKTFVEVIIYILFTTNHATFCPQGRPDQHHTTLVQDDGEEKALSFKATAKVKKTVFFYHCFPM